MKFDTIQLRSEVRIDYLLNKKLEKSTLQRNSIFANSTILRQPIGTNFKLDQAEADEIERIINERQAKDPSTLQKVHHTEEEMLPTPQEPEPTTTITATTTTTETTETPSTEGAPSNQKRCEICLMTDVAKVVVCSGCDQGFHIACIDPPMLEIPQENWYCNKCVALNGTTCQICSGAEDDDSMLLCDNCDAGFRILQRVCDYLE